MTGGEQIDLDNLREQAIEAIRNGDESAMRDLARLAIAALGRRGEGSGVLGVDVQRIRRALDLRTGRQPAAGPAGRAADARPDPPLRAAAAARARARADRAHAGSSRRRGRSTSSTARCRPARCRTSPPSTASSCSSSAGSPRRGTSRAGAAPTRTSTCAARCARRSRPAACPWCSSSGPQRPRRPELYVLCDVSTSVTSASVFFLSVLHALHDSFRKMRSFVFVERISEVTDVFARERNFKAVSEAIGRDAGVADVSGYTDYGRVWNEFLDAGRGRPAPARDGDRARRRAHERARPARRRLRARSPPAPAARSGSTPSRSSTGTTATRWSARTRRSASCTSAGRRRSSRTSSRR